MVIVARTTNTRTNARWLDDDEMRAWRGLIEVTLAINADLDTDLAEAYGLNQGDYAVLVSLSEAPDRRLRMCDLAACLRLSPSGLTRRLDGLVRDGLVAREPAPDDRRVSFAVLTAKGWATLKAAAPLHVDGVRRHFLDHLTRMQIQQLGATFASLKKRRTDANEALAG
jgi:DNA-binding MarR family transcriptional regulator